MKYILLLLSAILLVGCSNPIDTVNKQEKMYQFRTVVTSGKTVVLDTTISSESKVMNMNTTYTAPAGDVEILMSITNDSDKDTVNAVWAVETDMTTSEVIGSAIPKNSFTENLSTSLVGGTYTVNLIAE